MMSRSKLLLAIASIVTFYYFFAFLFANQNIYAQTNIEKKTEENVTNKAVKKSDIALVTFVEIGSVKCIPCKAMQPIMKAVETEYKGQVKIVFHDVWTPKGKTDAMKYQIRVIPTQVFLDKDGKEYFRHEGYFPKDDLVKVIKMQGVK